MKTIGIFTAGYGHESIARAIAEKISREAGKKYKVKIFFREQEPDLLDIIYNSIYKLNPSALGPSFQISFNLLKKDKKTRKIVDSIFLANYEEKVRAFIKKNKIDLCISTYFQFNSSLEKIQSEGIPFINIITDPKTTHPVMLTGANLDLVFNDYITKQYKNKNMKKAGWFVREKFEKDYDKKSIRKKLKIDDSLTFLISSGSEGANAVLKILPSIINCDKKVNFIVACGKNDFLYKNTIGIKQSLERLSSSKARIIPLAYTKNMHLYIQAADMVIGKAGPNTIFESIACETAFFAITHIHGQEDGNLDLIRDFGIGIVEENTKKANQELEKLIKNPEKIDSFTKNIKKLKEYNKNSINILLEEIDKLLN